MCFLENVTCNKILFKNAWKRYKNGNKNVKDYSRNVKVFTSEKYRKCIQPIGYNACPRDVSKLLKILDVSLKF